MEVFMSMTRMKSPSSFLSFTQGIYMILSKGLSLIIYKVLLAVFLIIYPLQIVSVIIKFIPINMIYLWQFIRIINKGHGYQSMHFKSFTIRVVIKMYRKISTIIYKLLDNLTCNGRMIRFYSFDYSIVTNLIFVRVLAYGYWFPLHVYNHSRVSN